MHYLFESHGTWTAHSAVDTLTALRTQYIMDYLVHTNSTEPNVIDYPLILESKMPFSRFAKMPSEKRERLLTIAAQEFAAHGFEAASLNHILKQTHMGKSSAYYYFADKADLFLTVVEYCFERLQLAPPSEEMALLSADRFWAVLIERYDQPLLHAQRQPWLFGAIRAAERLTPETLQQESLAPLAKYINNYMMSNLTAMIKRGQELGLIRTDVPNELLIAWFRGLDSASDDWLLAHMNDFDQETISHFARQTIAAIQAALAPSTL